MGNALVVSVLYLMVAVTLTIWLAGTLYRNGLQVLREREGQHPTLAEATSRLLVIGFALFTLGYAFLLLRVEDQMSNVEALQFLIRRLGILLVSLGIIHLVNTLIFLRFRRARSEDDTQSTVRTQQRRRGTVDGPPGPPGPPSEQARLRE
jgi:membrane-associated PAP2 superfamily phosphatase